MKKIRLLLTSLMLALPSLALAHPERHYRETAPEMPLAGALAAGAVVILGYLYLLHRRAARQGN